MIFEEKVTTSKMFFKWLDMGWHSNYAYTGGGHIFWNGVMHVNMAKA
jgi:hypothetical protein